MFKKINKKASGSALTWIPATVLIAFIMIVHLIFSGVLYAYEGDKTEVIISKGETRLAFTGAFLAFLESEVEVNEKLVSVKELFVNENKKILEQELEKKIIGPMDPECYGIIYGDIFIENIRIRLKKQYSNVGNAIDWVKKKSYKSIFVLNGKEHEIKYYFGDCNE